MPWCVEMLNAKLMACRESSDPEQAIEMWKLASELHGAFPDNVTIKVNLLY